MFSEPESGYAKHLSDGLFRRFREWRAASERLAPQGDEKNIERFRIAVDISSMTRERLAQTLMAVVSGSDVTAEVDFYYAIARFAPLVGSEGIVTVNQPLEGFEGWFEDPSLPVACVIGAGFEGNLALGAIEQLEPAVTFVFVPTGVDNSYDTILEQRNSELFRSSDVRLITYDVSSPFECLTYLDSLVHRLVSDYRVVLVPLGPKIFCLGALLASIMQGLRIAVWRLSAGDDREPQNRVPLDRVVGLRMEVGM